MNTHDIELPPLPDPYGYFDNAAPGWSNSQVRDAQRAAIEEDRKRTDDLIAKYQEKVRALEAENYSLVSDLDDRQARGEPECGHCGGTGDVSGEYPGIACLMCGGTGKAPQLSQQANEPVVWPVAKEDDVNKGWLLDYHFLEQVEKLASQRTNFTTSMEAAEQVLLAALEVLRATPQPQQIPEGYKLVPDYKVGMRVKFKGMEYDIFAKGDRPGTFDICLPNRISGDRWLNVPPDALEMLKPAPEVKQ